MSDRPDVLGRELQVKNCKFNVIVSSLTKICQKRHCILTFKNEKLAKKVDFRKFLDPIWDLALKRVSKFVIHEFRHTLWYQKSRNTGTSVVAAFICFINIVS